MTGAARSAVAVVALGCLLGPLTTATAGQAAASGSFTSRTPAAVASAEDTSASSDSELMLVMDSSGSMAERAGGEMSR